MAPAARRDASWAAPREGGLLGILGLLVLVGSCSVPCVTPDHPTLLIQATPVPADLSAILTVVSLNGTEVRRLSQGPSGDPAVVEISLSQGSRGAIEVQLSCARADGCVVSRGRGGVTINADGQVSLSIAPTTLATPECPSPSVKTATLGVQRRGAGRGRVVSEPLGIDCGDRCSAALPQGVVTLTARPDGTSRFSGWTGACTGLGPCTVTLLDGGAQVTATFEAKSCIDGRLCKEAVAGGAADEGHWRAVWGTAADDVWIVGYDHLMRAAILHWDGVTLSRVMLNDPEAYAGPLAGVWGSGKADVWAVGPSASMLRYNGARWSKVAITTPNVAMQGVWGSAANDVYAVGYLQTAPIAWIHHFDGKEWTGTSLPAAKGFSSVWGTGADNIYADGGYTGVYRSRNQMPFAIEDIGTPGNALVLQGIGGSGANDVWAVGPADRAFRYRDGAWKTVMLPDGSTLMTGVWAKDPSDAWTVGFGGRIAHHDGTAFYPVSSGTRSDLYGVWGIGDTDVWIVGLNNTVLHYQRP